MKVVLDTNVLISATLWDQSVAQRLLFALIRNEIEIYSSKSILEEYSRILIDKFRFSLADVDSILEKLSHIISIVEPKERIIFIKDDIDDDKILECAVEAKSRIIITYDKHLLNIIEFRGIHIRKPEEILLEYFS